MNKTGLGALCIGALCSLMIGCGGGGSVDIKDLENEDLNAVCDRAVACGQASSHDSCVALFGAFIDLGELKGSVDAGKVKYDGEKAKACLDAIGSASCDPSVEENRVTNQDCVDTFTGTVADGGACENSYECISQSCTASGGTPCSTGTCNATPPANAQIGQACGTSGNNYIYCVDGAYCNASNQCAALLAKGSTCTSDDECAYGTVCAGATAMTCQTPPQKVGDACISHNGNSADCVIDGLYCAGTTCAAYADSGGTCGNTTPCMLDLSCNGTTCGALPAVGASCSSFCAPGAYCDFSTTSPTCAALKANGTTCAGDSECTSNNCDSTSMKCADVTYCI